MGAWFEALTPDMVVEQEVNGTKTNVPLRDLPFVKESPDLGTFVKRSYDNHREVGSRIPVRASTDEERVAWRKDHLPKLQQAGLIPTPPANPEAYEIKKPAEMPKGLAWNDDRAKSFATVAHKHGISKEAMPELMALHNQALVEMHKNYQLDVDYDKGIAALKTEHGAHYEERAEMTKRLTASIFKSPEELAFLEATGIGNHPNFLSILMRLAPLAQQDSSVLNEASRPGGSMTVEQVRAEVADIMNNPANPKYTLFRMQDKATMDYIDELYRKIPGGADKVNISGASVTKVG